MSSNLICIWIFLGFYFIYVGLATIEKEVKVVPID
jgi:hypothetical protein